MLILSISCLVISLITFLIFLKTKEITLFEAVIMVAVPTAVVGLGLFLATLLLTRDLQTFSGKVVSVIHTPEWVETYQESHTVSTGKNTRYTYYTTEYRTHDSLNEANINYGGSSESIYINDSVYREFLKRLNGRKVIREGTRYGYFSGDKNDYITYAVPSSDIISSVKTAGFSNRVKASTSLFTYPGVKNSKYLFDYPENENRWVSDRVLGKGCKDITVKLVDKLNAELGPKKKVNLIFIGFNGKSEDLARSQEAKWKGGKKNDLVICYSEFPRWCYVFGWTEKDIVKRSIESLFITSDKLDKNILKEVEKEVVQNYELKNWEKFNYLTIIYPTWVYIFIALLTLLIQGILYSIFLNNYDRRD